ncbi:LysR family transcriptional regulator [Lentibacillus cibarius]|uniref:LysR family transcriptional regulator n=1 Tax=Lentibacillus cibarius TaxID=2583219 RepID=A0A5S3QMC8_9BACI|nr:LysR family transcriptional regulator [Lentibacillus cibarius]TMN23114.1 LysR family transcriptional regulator [Lentibacillus cibarius]
MDLKQLYYFKTIVDTGSISKAAKALYMAQPPLSQNLKRLETELDATLIYRTNRQWKLTEAGSTLYERAVIMLQKSADIVTEIQEISQGARGTLAIGVSSTCISYLPRMIKTFRAAYPNVYLKIWKGDSSYLEELLQEGIIEIAFMLLPMQLDTYHFSKLGPEPFVIATPTQWEAQLIRKDIQLEQIVHYPFLMLAPMEGYAVYENIIQHFHKHHLSPNVIMECKDISTLLALVASGVGLSILPKSAIQKAFYHDIVAIDMKNFGFSIEPSVIWLKNHRLSKAAERFLMYTNNNQV